MPDTPSSTVKVEEIRPCPDGTYNIVLEGANFDLNFTGQALVDLGVLTPMPGAVGGYGAAPGVRWRDVVADRVNFVDVRPEPSRTVTFEDLYRYVPIIRRADTLYHAVQWRPDDDSKSATRFQQVKTFVDQHSACDFSIHHQTTTDRLIIRRHDRSVPIVMEMGEWLIAEVETSQLTVLTPAEYNARYCEAP